MAGGAKSLDQKIAPCRVQQNRLQLNRSMRTILSLYNFVARLILAIAIYRSCLWPCRAQRSLCTAFGGFSMPFIWLIQGTFLLRTRSGDWGVRRNISLSNMEKDILFTNKYKGGTAKKPCKFVFLDRIRHGQMPRRQGG